MIPALKECILIAILARRARLYPWTFFYNSFINHIIIKIYFFPNSFKKGRKIWIWNTSISIRENIIPIKKCWIQNWANFLRSKIFFRNIFSYISHSLTEKFNFWFLITFFRIKTKNRAVYQKMIKIKFVNFFNPRTILWGSTTPHIQSSKYGNFADFCRFFFLHIYQIIQHFLKN